MLQVHFTPFPVIATDRLILRRIEFRDAPDMFALRSDPELMKYIGKPRAQSIDEMDAFVQKVINMIESDEGVAWAMTLKDQDRLMGHISFHRIMKEHFRAEVGYMMLAEYHGKGIMDEALKAVLAYGFHTMGLHSVEANVSPENSASQKLLERNGFVREAHFRENFYFDGRYLDSVIYSLLAPAPAT